MKRLLALLFLLVPAGVLAQTAALPVQQCMQPGTQAAVSGLLSTNYQMGIVPSCTVTVYLTGTQTIATTTPQTPLTASPTGQFLIYAPINAGYDVVLSGGISPNTYPSPVTITNQFAGGSGCINGGSLAQGCTGGTTALAAAANIVQLVTWVAITEPPYNAVGDCTYSGSTSGCTANVTNIQAAIDYCFTVGCTVMLPANPNTTNGQTVYYLGGTLNPRGVSIIGPDGAGGYTNVAPAVVLRGAPGMDVFATGDPMNSGWTNPKSAFRLAHMGLDVDDTEDVSCGTGSCAAFVQNRLPGRTAFDCAITSSTAILTCTAQAHFRPGDTYGPSGSGQAIEVWGAGTQACTDGSGSTCLITTIQSWQSDSQVTLAANATNTVSSAHVYVSVLNYAVGQTLGNAAWAYDNAASGTAAGTSGAQFEDVSISTVSGRPQNQSVGFLYQGQSSIYGSTMTKISVKGVTNFAFLCSDLAVAQNHNCGLGGYVKFDSMWLTGYNPWLSYGGAQITLKSVELSNSLQGVQALSAYSLTPTSSWDIGIPEEESPSGNACGTGVAYRIDGLRMHIVHLGAPLCTTGQAALLWDASGTPAGNDVLLSTFNPINISGSGNNFFSASYASYAINWNITGGGNTFETCLDQNPFGGIASLQCNYGGASGTNFGPPNIARSQVLFEATPDFISTGAVNNYRNKGDLWLWPSNIFGYNGTTPAVISDGNLESGSAWSFPASSTPDYTMMQEGNSFMIIGTTIPAGESTLYFYAESIGGTQSFYADAVYGTSGNPGTSLSCSFKTTPMSLTTTYAVYSCPINISTSLIGDRFGVRLGANHAITNGVSVGWIAIKPWNSDFAATSATIGAGSTPITGSVGTGGNAVEASALGTATDCANWTAAGIGDSGGPCNSPIYGYTTLSSGTVTVSNSAACTASATCAYKLTNCGQVGSALGYLVVGNVVAGTSFVINSESAALAIVTTDNSHVCWQIN